MATYVNNLRLKEIATGDESGTWGTSTNTNLELIGEALGIGTEAITSNADTHTTTVADGSADAGRAMYLKYTGALDSDCTITIGPNTMKRVQIIENATTDSGSSGPYNIIISQGSGANVTIANGKVAIVQLDGAGSGAAVLDALTDLQVTDTLSVNGTTITLGDGTAEDTKLVYDGNAKDFYIGLDDSADKLVIGEGSTVGTNNILTITDDTVTLGDGAAVDTAIVFDGNAQDFYVGLDDSADDLLIGLGSTVGTTPIISVDENKDVAIPDGGLTITTSDNTDQLSLVSTDADANSGPNLRMYRNSGSPADGDVLGAIEFEGRNDNSEDIKYAELFAETYDVSDGTEDGRFFIKTMVGGSSTHRMYMNFNETNFNEGGADIDFRVESDGSANMLFVDAGNDRIGINTSSPDSMLHLYKATGSGALEPELKIENNHNTSSVTDGAGRLTFYSDDSNNSGIPDLAWLGQIRFMGDDKDGSAQEFEYSYMVGQARDAGGGSSRKGGISFYTRDGDSVTETVTITENKVGIATTSPSHKLETSDGAVASKYDATDHVAIRGLSSGQYIQYGSGRALSFVSVDTYPNSGASTVMSLTGGKVFIGDTSFGGTAAKFAVEVPASGAGCLIKVDSSADANETMLQFQDAAGQAQGSITSNPSANTTAYNTSSDGRLKDITGEAKGLEIINELNPVAFTWKSSGVKAEGLIAQEVEKLVDHAVSKTKESEYLQMDYSKLVTPLIKAVQELSAEVEELKQQAHDKCEN